jgi:hypothetical protein
MSLPADGPQMFTADIEEEQLARAGVGDHYRPVTQSCGTFNTEQVWATSLMAQFEERLN